MSVKISFLIAAFIAALTYSSDAVDYCRIKTCDQNSHTMCRYPTAGASSACTRNLGGGLDSSDRKRILDRHNYYRQLVASGGERRGSPGPQPPAKYMPNLVWDNELANIAQRWADQCNYGHDDCRDVERYEVGQNIATKGTTRSVDTIDITAMVDSWYNEVEDYNKNNVDRYSGGVSMTGKKIGHYTQLLWAKTTAVGCGSRKYNDGRFNQIYLVCNYGPSGNWRDQPVYERR